MSTVTPDPSEPPNEVEPVDTGEHEAEPHEPTRQAPTPEELKAEQGDKPDEDNEPSS